MHHDSVDCSAARERLSARLDGELQDERALRSHLARCDDCRTYEQHLSSLAHGFDALRGDELAVELWPRIERSLRVRALRPALSRAAATVLGFVSLGGMALLFERAADAPVPEQHLFERLTRSAQDAETLFASLPEYRLLRGLPREESR